MASPLQNSIQFLQAFGLFDVILPFLLVFTVVYGILEKTKVFGEEEIKGKKRTRKNINSMIAFTIAFFVVAATQVVAVMQAALPYIVLVLVFIIAFLILFGATMGEGQINIWEDNKKLKGVFLFGIFVSMIAIILGAFGLLGDLVNWIHFNFTSTAVTTTIVLIVVIAAVWFVMYETGKDKSE